MDFGSFQVRRFTSDELEAILPYWKPVSAQRPFLFIKTPRRN
jgi:hypothetical protein